MAKSNRFSFATTTTTTTTTLINTNTLFFFLFLSILSLPQLSCIQLLHEAYSSPSSSSQFPQLPPGFLWGTATAAYQVEGAHDVDGRGPSVWDTFSNTPGKIADSSTGNDAVNHYFRLEEDLDILKSMQVNVYRFSISWSRIFPTGRGPTPNQKGVEFYDRLINGLKKRGIEPFITLFHWDLPQFLETNHSGWLGQTTVDEFVNYADFCFNHFGDRVKYWLTFNEPHSFLVHGYSSGWHAPGRCSNRLICVTGNTSTEPYLAGHNVLRAHAYAVDLYRRKYQSTQKGKIGITVDISHYEPYDPNSQLDIEAAERAAIWHGGWFVDPVYFGDYPAVMKERVGNRLPKWSEEDRILIKGSSDFFGLNHYTTSYAIHVESVDDDIEGYYRDRGCVTTSERDGKLIGPRGEPTWLFVVPRGMRGVLNWVSNRYGNPDIYITENGVSAPGENRMKIEDALEDQFRVDYYRDYIDEMSKAVKIDGVNVIGYMAWSLYDNFEWADGYEKRFGLFYVDFKNNFTRIPKKSAKWYAKLIELNSS